MYRNACKCMSNPVFTVLSVRACVLFWAGSSTQACCHGNEFMGLVYRFKLLFPQLNCNSDSVRSRNVTIYPAVNFDLVFGLEFHHLLPIPSKIQTEDELKGHTHTVYCVSLHWWLYERWHAFTPGLLKIYEGIRMVSNNETERLWLAVNTNKKMQIGEESAMTLQYRKSSQGMTQRVTRGMSKAQWMTRKRWLAAVNQINFLNM